jgi:hypothetical protein
VNTIAYHIASLLEAIENCRSARNPNPEWEMRHARRLRVLVDNYLPSGCGWDCGTKLDTDKSTPTRLVFYGEFHHMDDTGSYDGWTQHTITVHPAFDGVLLTISGQNRNDIKEYLHELFYNALMLRIDRIAIDALYAREETRT